jgi:hypothetical protein
MDRIYAFVREGNLDFWNNIEVKGRLQKVCVNNIDTDGHSIFFNKFNQFLVLISSTDAMLF